jgi:hypothetical protein
MGEGVRIQLPEFRIKDIEAPNSCLRAGAVASPYSKHRAGLKPAPTSIFSILNFEFLYF